MIKIIYHGSDHIIEQPKFSYGKPYNDYGIGFYCTENPDMAKEWGGGLDYNGYANQYQINCDGLSILDLHTSEYTLLHWLTILLENREFDTVSLRPYTGVLDRLGTGLLPMEYRTSVF